MTSRLSEDIPYGNIDSPATLGLLVRRRRRADGLTQAQAAGLCGVGTRFLGELERGKETAELGKVLQVLRGLGLDVAIVPRGGGKA
ncbi:MAG: helix-turn-helix transcriptional regulator [Anaeromyxobacter sp.]|nr:helix-turn-helix transcriptional regulator [Anaeromyxobacter sp.]MBL0276945.1 helix-turn-helix transcriptional regulator [Anaeromyxobacter sp.]